MKRLGELMDRLKVKVNRTDADKKKTMDLLRDFRDTFDSPSGQKVLKYLEEYSHKNFPNYENANATYSKIGEQSLVGHIKGMIFNAKKGGV